VYLDDWLDILAQYVYLSFLSRLAWFSGPHMIHNEVINFTSDLFRQINQNSHNHFSVIKRKIEIWKAQILVAGDDF